MLRFFKVLVDFPALDRLLDYLASTEQSEVDAANAQIAALTVRLKQSTDKLQPILDKGKSL